MIGDLLFDASMLVIAVLATYELVMHRLRKYDLLITTLVTRDDRWAAFFIGLIGLAFGAVIQHLAEAVAR